jgi:hypothetical protein
VCIGGHDLGGKIGLVGVGGVQRGHERHRVFLTVGAGFRGVRDGWREETAEGGKDLARYGGGLVGDGIHSVEVDVRLGDIKR